MGVMAGFTNAPILLKAVLDVLDGTDRDGVPLEIFLNLEVSGLRRSPMVDAWRFCSATSGW